MATQPQTDERGFVIDPDHVARQRLIDERCALFTLSRRVDAMLAEYDTLIGNAGYPAAGRAFDRAFAALCRSAQAVFHGDELGELAKSFDPDWIAEEQREPVSIDERFGVCSWVQA
jgi:hypothetical protein